MVSDHGARYDRVSPRPPPAPAARLRVRQTPGRSGGTDCWCEASGGERGVRTTAGCTSPSLRASLPASTPQSLKTFTYGRCHTAEGGRREGEDNAVSSPSGPRAGRMAARYPTGRGARGAMAGVDEAAARAAHRGGGGEGNSRPRRALPLPLPLPGHPSADIRTTPPAQERPPSGTPRAARGREQRGVGGRGGRGRAGSIFASAQCCNSAIRLMCCAD